MTYRRNKSYSEWRTLRISNPSKFYDPKTQKLMVDDAKALGNSFFDRENIIRDNEQEDI